VHARTSTYGRRKLATAPRPEPSAALSVTAADAGDFATIRKLIWVYFWLLLIEGALRKWILPQLANPLLLVRDPVVLLIYLSALKRGIFPMNGFTLTCFILAVGNSFATLFVGQENLFVTLFGLRTAFFFIPLIFIIPAVFNREDVEKIGSWFLIASLPMAFLVLLQFRSSPDAWINRGVGGTVGAQLDVGFGKIRPPGTFSFTSGLAIFLSFAAAFILSYQLKKWPLNNRVSLGAMFAVGTMAAVSGSRGAIVALVLIAAAMLYACVRTGKFFGAGLRTAVLLSLVWSVLLFRQEVRQGVIVHENRVTTGGGVQVGLIDRTLSGFTEPFSDLSNIPILGKGIGLGTTAAGGLLYGERSFILAEGEWLRVIHESGPILGLIYLGMRIAIAVLLFVRASEALADENPLPILLFAAVCPLVVSGQFGVPTILGFATFGAGLCLAAARPVQEPVAATPFQLSPDSATNPLKTVRGRSIYAEKLHGR
jgi:hypothetical protein